MSEITVGIDIGTTSVKAVAADGEGSILERARIPHHLHAPDVDTFEHDPREAWVDGVLAAWEHVSRGREVAAVTVSAMVPSLCGVDAQGSPVTAGLLYGDARGRGHGSGSGIDGEVVGFAGALSKAPGVAALWPAQAVANHALCGVGAIDTASAMAMAPLFTGTGWDDVLLDALAIDADQLPATSPGPIPIGRRGATAVNGGTIDALAEQTVADARTPGDVLVICGTTLIPWALSRGWPEAPGLWTMPYSVPDVVAIGGASNAGGLFIDRVRAMTGDPAQDAVLAVEAGDRPIWLPYIRGERTPFHDHAKKAQLLELAVGHGPAEVLAAAYDAAGFVVRHHLDLAASVLDEAGTPPQRIVAAGGGTQSTAWMQALADVTGLPVDVSAHPEGAALGAAFNSRLTAGLETDSTSASAWARIGRRVEPRPDHHEAASARYARFRSIVDEPHAVEGRV